MYCQTVFLRAAGLKTRAGRRIEGELSTSSGRGGLVAQLTAPLSMTPFAELYDVRLISVRDGALVLRGFEKAEGRAVLQEWHCRPVDTEHGFDAAGRRLEA